MNKNKIKTVSGLLTVVLLTAFFIIGWIVDHTEDKEPFFVPLLACICGAIITFSVWLLSPAEFDNK